MQKNLLETFQKGNYIQFMVENFSRIIGNNLRNLRKAARLSQKDIGQLLGVSYQQVQKYESGLSLLPLDKFYRLKGFYNVPYETLLAGLKETEPRIVR
jgi:transcriptional regulator with XRE-family HTH domain